MTCDVYVSCQMLQVPLKKEWSVNHIIGVDVQAAADPEDWIGLSDAICKGAGLQFLHICFSSAGRNSLIEWIIHFPLNSVAEAQNGR